MSTSRTARLPGQQGHTYPKATECLKGRFTEAVGAVLPLQRGVGRCARAEQGAGLRAAQKSAEFCCTPEDAESGAAPRVWREVLSPSTSSERSSRDADHSSQGPRPLHPHPALPANAQRTLLGRADCSQNRRGGCPEETDVPEETKTYGPSEFSVKYMLMCFLFSICKLYLGARGVFNHLGSHTGRVLSSSPSLAVARWPTVLSAPPLQGSAVRQDPWAGCML